MLGLTDVEKELAVIQAKLELLRAQEEEYESLIADITGRRDSVTRDIEALERKGKSIAAMRIPVNWLPNEILGQIFLCLTEKEWNPDAPSSPLLTDPPITVSHVSQRWRAVALSTPYVWSFIHFRGRWNEARVRIFLSRSQCSPLEIIYRVARRTELVVEMEEVRRFLDILGPVLARLKRLNVYTLTPDAMWPIVQTLNQPTRRFSNLRSLTLSIRTFDPTYTTAGGLLANNQPGELYTFSRTAIPFWSHLTSLTLEELPLFNLPHYFLAKLTYLELCHPPRKTRPSRTRYQFRLSSLLHFLSATAVLEELTLNNTVPIFDITLADEDAPSNTSSAATPPVKLPCLKAISWTFPLFGEVYHLLSFINTPALEKIDIWVEDRTEASWRTSQHPPSSQPASQPTVIDYPSVEELCFQCPTGDECSISSLRKFTFPNLRRLELTNTIRSFGSSKQKPSSETPRAFPRVETIFRDPRLFLLTHLTVSNFEFKAEHGRAESVLGYMPALTSLSLESCFGTANLIKVLGERCTVDVHGAKVPRRAGRSGVRVCPRLEALSFWGCDDLRIGSLIQVVLARNGDVNGAERGELAPIGVGREPDPHPVTSTDAITGAESTSEKGTGGGNAETATPPRVMGRKIRPLRRTAMRQVSSTAPFGAGELHPPAPSSQSPILDFFSLAHEVAQPSPILYTRIHGCALICQQDSVCLKELGVTDVVWLGDE
ncbi:hypothetical protein D9611_013608 [Ephemerocybe angulata]|uniref:F-box domain-containing protein n=1 Tax=Ephemerocybe angulata TaxID=980116 RepID=A0A8H5ARX5_9AGAR|nr:hypothetical protein D9611_013608 [Tulosesus angulatus]